MKTIKKTLVIAAAFLAGIVLMPLAPLALAWMAMCNYDDEDDDED